MPRKSALQTALEKAKHKHEISSGEKIHEADNETSPGLAGSVTRFSGGKGSIKD